MVLITIDRYYIDDKDKCPDIVRFKCKTKLEFPCKNSSLDCDF